MGTWYGVSSAVYAYVVASPSETENPNFLEKETPPREVRLVVVGQENNPLPEVEEIDARGTDKETKTEREPEESLSQQEAEILLAELMGEGLAPVLSEETEESEEQPAPARTTSTRAVFTVPFYSQFSDISAVSWQKVGCGIASLAMLIDFYSEEKFISVDDLLDRGVSAGAYLDSAGWIHSGLIGLSRAYGLDGESQSLAGLSMSEAFARLETAVAEGPVMVSVHYTFEPTNPIPHLVVVNGIRDGKVYYNDPAEVSGGNALSIEKFQRAWKKRYIEIRPV